MEATELHKKIELEALKSDNKIRVIKTMEIDQYIRQGDVYLIKIKEVTGGVELESRQLAPGTTKGSRHIIEDSPNISIFQTESLPDIKSFGSTPEKFQEGPQIKSIGRFKLTHPEHGWFDLPKGNYQVLYQTDFARKERVKD